MLVWSMMVLIGGSMIGLIVWARGDADRLRVTPASIAGFASMHRLTLTDPVFVAVDRTLTRHRSHRYHGGAAGVLVAFVVAISRPGGFTIGVGIGPALFPDPLLCILSGVLLGVISAESHHLRARPAGEPRIASLEVRGPEPIGKRRNVAGRLIAGAAAVAIAVDTAAHPGIVWTCAVLIVAVTALVAWQQRRIVRRARPVLPAELAETDLAVRRSGSDAIDDAGSGLVLLLLANAVASSGAQANGLVTVVSVVLFAAAVACWRRSRIWVVRSSAWPKFVPA